MGRMTLSENATLRLQGWRVFRSSSRDRVIPMSGPGGKLQRIKIAEALPSSGIDVGVTLTLAEREAIANQRRLDRALAERESVSKPLGITKYFHVNCRTEFANPSATELFDETINIGPAPFDGFITEYVSSGFYGPDLLGVAIRSSGGESLFRSFTNFPVTVGQGVVAPDFLSFTMSLNGVSEPAFRNLHMPVFAGEDIFVVTRVRGGAAALQQLPVLVLGFEAFTLAKAGSAAAISAFTSLAEDSRIASRQASDAAARLQLQQHKDAAALERAKIDLEIARIKSTVQPGPTGLRVGGFESVLGLESALQQLQSRAAAVPIPKPAPPPSSAPVEGQGMTFVRSWMPSSGHIGYLIPDPPRGGKVTVFDSKYNIWDLSGRNVGSGLIQPVNVEADIPPGARISR